MCTLEPGSWRLTASPPLPGEHTLSSALWAMARRLPPCPATSANRRATGSNNGQSPQAFHGPSEVPASAGGWGGGGLDREAAEDGGHRGLGGAG